MSIVLRMMSIVSCLARRVMLRMMSMTSCISIIVINVWCMSHVSYVWVTSLMYLCMSHVSYGWVTSLESCLVCTASISRCIASIETWLIHTSLYESCLVCMSHVSWVMSRMYRINLSLHCIKLSTPYYHSIPWLSLATYIYICIYL